MLFIYRWIKGYLKVRFYGDFFEKILDIAALNGITLWGLRLVKNGIEAHITVKDFKKLRSIKKRRGIKAKILLKKGLPFHIKKHRHRAGFLLGLVVFIAFIELMSGYVWVIEVEGNETVPDQTILSKCEELGIVCGIPSSYIDPKVHRQLLLMKSEELAWASFNVEGSKLTVNVSETRSADKKTGASNLKALYDGIIKGIDIKSGSCVVKAGDVVKKGDLLVSGVVEESGQTKFLNAEGKIIAETIQEITLTEAFLQKEYIASPDTERRYLLEVFALKLPLYLGSIKGEYESEYSVSELSLFGAKLPLKLHKRSFTYGQTVEIKYSEAELKERLEARFEAHITEMGARNFEITNKEFTVTEEGVELRATVKAEIDICISEPILVAQE